MFHVCQTIFFLLIVYFVQPCTYVVFLLMQQRELTRSGTNKANSILCYSILFDSGTELSVFIALPAHACCADLSSVLLCCAALI